MVGTVVVVEPVAGHAADEAIIAVAADRRNRDLRLSRRRCHHPKKLCDQCRSPVARFSASADLSSAACVDMRRLGGYVIDLEPGQCNSRKQAGWTAKSCGGRVVMQMRVFRSPLE
jgi:hypothetical protein